MSFSKIFQILFIVGSIFLIVIPECLTWRIMVFQKGTCQFKLLWPVTSSFGLIKISTVRNHHYTTDFIFMHKMHVNLKKCLKYKIATRTACAVERGENRRSIWEHPTVQMYDPWGLGSGQSEHTAQIERQSSSLSTGNAVRLGIDLYAKMHDKCQKMSYI